MRVCVLTTCFPELPFTLLEKLFKSCYLSWSQGSVKLKPCRSSRRCPVIRSPSSALFRVSSCFVSTGVELFQNPLLFLSFSSEPQHALAKAASRPSSTGWSLKIPTAGSSAAEVFFPTNGRTAFANCCLCFVALLHSPKAFSQTHDVHQMGSLSVPFCESPPPLSSTLLYPPPPVCSSLSMPWMFMMLFILKMTINFTLLLFFYEYIYR